MTYTCKAASNDNQCIISTAVINCLPWLHQLQQPCAPDSPGTHPRTVSGHCSGASLPVHNFTLAWLVCSWQWTLGSTSQPCLLLCSGVRACCNICPCFSWCYFSSFSWRNFTLSLFLDSSCYESPRAVMPLLVGHGDADTCPTRAILDTSESWIRPSHWLALEGSDSFFSPIHGS